MGCSAEKSISQDAGSQSPFSLHLVFGSLAESLIHPIAGFALFNPFEADALDFKFFADPMIQGNTPNQHIAPEDRWRQIPTLQFLT